MHDKIQTWAREIIAFRIGLFMQEPEYEPASIESVDELYRPYYDLKSRELELLDFRLLADYNLVYQITDFRYALFCRMFRNADSTVTACITVNPHTPRSRFNLQQKRGVLTVRQICFTTEFRSGDFLSTGSEFDVLAECQNIPGRTRYLLPGDTSYLLSKHLDRVQSDFKNEEAIATPTLEEFRASCMRDREKLRIAMKTIGFVDPKATVDLIFRGDEEQFGVRNLKNRLEEALEQERLAAIALFSQ